MCPPKKPKVETIPVRAAAVLPDQGDPAVRQSLKARKRLTASAMTFTKQGTLGAPSVSGPLGSTGAGR